MTLQLGPLIQASLRDPRKAAQEIMGLSLGRDALWLALALVAIFNTFLIHLVLQISVPDIPVPGYFYRPLALFFLIAGVTVVYVHAMYWAGLAIGGQGRLADVLLVVVWFQVLRAMAQVALILLSLALPSLGGLLSLVVAVWGFWIFLNFITAALNLRSVWHGFAVLVLSFAGLVMTLGIIVALVGGLAPGSTV